MTIAEQITRAKADYDEVYEAGQQVEYDRFWDMVTNNGTRTTYPFAFSYGSLGGDMPPDKFESATLTYNMFYCSTFARLPDGFRMPNLSATATGMSCWAYQMFDFAKIEYMPDFGAPAPMEAVGVLLRSKSLRYTKILYSNLHL